MYVWHFEEILNEAAEYCQQLKITRYNKVVYEIIFRVEPSQFRDKSLSSIFFAISDCNFLIFVMIESCE